MNSPLRININKCRVMTFSRIDSNITYDYTVDDNVISRVHQMRDLGVVLDERLSFIHHIQYVCEYATRMMGYVYRNTRYQFY